MCSAWRVPDTRPDPVIFGNTQSVPDFFQNHRVFRVSGISLFLAGCAFNCLGYSCRSILFLNHTTFVKSGQVSSHHCKEFNPWSHTNEIWEQLNSTLCTILHLMYYINSSFQEICSLVTHYALLSRFVVVEIYTLFCHCLGLKSYFRQLFCFYGECIYGKQIICSLWYPKFDV